MTLADRVRRFDQAEWGPAWLRRMARGTRIDQISKFEDNRTRQRFVIGSIVVLALIGIVAGVGSGDSVFGATRSFFAPDGGTVLFVGAIVLLNLGVWAVVRWRSRKRKASVATDR